MTSPYPSRSADRTRWILEQRGPKNPLDPFRPYAHFWEDECGPDGKPLATLTVLLTNRECPYRCLMCDLWQNTLDERVPVGAIPTQLEFVLQTMPGVPKNAQIKLYNAGSFFDPNAIPPEDYARIANLTAGFDRIIVECHPALIGERTLLFRDLLGKRKLEVAIGLETVHPDILERLNKRFTVQNFQQKAAFLKQNGIDLRVFLLLRPPFLSEEEGLEWACRSLDTAFTSGASVCCLIPTRGGNGAMELLAQSGEYAPPSLASLEKAVAYGLQLGKGRVFADLWDIEKFYTDASSQKQAARLAQMNQTQLCTVE